MALILEAVKMTRELHSLFGIFQVAVWREARRLLSFGAMTVLQKSLWGQMTQMVTSHHQFRLAMILAFVYKSLEMCKILILSTVVVDTVGSICLQRQNVLMQQDR
jgi:hypothetical protein